MDYLTIYQADLDFRGLSEETKYRYLRLIRLFMDSEKDYTRQGVQAFLQSLKGRGTYKRWCFGVLKSFFECLEINWPFKSGEGPKLNKPLQPFLTEDECRTLLEMAQAESDTHFGMFRIAAVTISRRVEISRLNVSDYDGSSIRIDTAKGGDPRVLTLDEETIKALDAISSGRGPNEALFRTSAGVRISPHALGAIFRKYRRRMGLPEGTGLHAIRRGVTTLMFKGGMRETELQAFGGWKSPAMVARYVQLTPGEASMTALETNPLVNAQ